MHKFRQLNEALDWIVKGTDENDIVARIHFCLQSDSSFRGYMMIAVQNECKIVTIPEGLPPNVKLERDIPEGMGHTTLRAEFRRVKSFVVGQPMERVKPFQRENVWVQILEGIHWKEAELLTHIKDQTLLGLYPALVAALPKAGVPITIDLGQPEPIEDEPTAPEGVTETFSDETVVAIQPETVLETDITKVAHLTVEQEVSEKTVKPKKGRGKKSEASGPQQG
jgi:hypothetical protein